MDGRMDWCPNLHHPRHLRTVKERETLKNEVNRHEGGSSVPLVLKMTSAQLKKMSEED